MSIEIVRGTTQKPASSEELADHLSQIDNLSGMLFIGFPIISTPEGPHPVDALLVSTEIGIVAFDLIEGTEIGDYKQRQDDLANELEARLRVHRGLVRRRKLLIEINAISFAPGVRGSSLDGEDDYPLVTDSETLTEALYRMNLENYDANVFALAMSAIESVSTIRKGRNRSKPGNEHSRGARLKKLEDSIATLDPKQNRAVIETVDGIQRIRGLAGSGKTIVLALKAAYLHSQHPDWRIAVTFNTRSLKGQFNRLITTFSLETGSEPNWENLRILNAWGAPGGEERDGVYHEFCVTNGIDYFDFGTARRRFSRGKEFSMVCEYALSQAGRSRPTYDAILVDEAQDFSPAFLRLCYELLKEPKRLVYAYDELQNLSGESMPPPEEIFGRNSDGSARVQFNISEGRGPRRDIILNRCYRNSRPVLVSAHALGFGVYRQAEKLNDLGLIQMFEHSHLWEEIGYTAKDGTIEEGLPVTLYRTPETSPPFLEDHSSVDDLIKFISFDSEAAQTEWLANAISHNLQHDELRHNDIIVVNPDPRTTQTKVGRVRERLLAMGISCHLAGVDTDQDVFFKSQDSVTFSGIYRAKGNEAGMIYIINAQDCHSAARSLASIRNQLFTAITRSKAWVRVLGYGSDMKALVTEYEELKRQNFELRFIYPTADQRKLLKSVHRDMTREEANRLNNRQKGLSDLVKDLESGNVRAEDLDESIVTRLKELLEKA